MIQVTKMNNCKLQHDVKNQARILCTVGVLILSGSYFVRGISLIPCGKAGVREVLANQDTVFTCTAEGRVQWRLGFEGTVDSELLATCEQTCDEMNNMNKLFIANTVDAPYSSSMTIRAADPQNVVQLLKGSLQCVLPDGTNHAASSRCNLSYSFPPEGVSCTAVNTSWSVTVSCLISSVYSSRGLYTCQLHRIKRGSKNETIERINMVTTPTTEKITNNEVKVSGLCQFNTTLPAEEGLYGFYVAISPGGQTYNAKLTVDFEWITNEGPLPPTMSCAPQPFVLENTNITCTCSTTSLGQPAGYLRWIIGNETNQATVSGKDPQDYRSQKTEYTHQLNLPDHEKTWFRCNAIWGQIPIHGKNYTANVGYSARQAKLLLNNREKNQTVREKEQVSFLCESNGRPTPNVSIYNNDNDTVMMTGRSPVTYMVTARCEDTTTYTCSAWNEFSRHVTRSLSLNLDVLCKPRSRLAKHLGEYIVDQKAEVNFDIIAYPAPHEHRVWFLSTLSNDKGSMENEVERSMFNITCNAPTVHRYLSTCTLTFFNVTSLSTGSYKIQLINEHGDENFTVVMTFPEVRDFQRINPVVLPSVVGAIIFFFAIVTLIGVLIKRKKTKAKQRIHVEQTEVNASLSNPEPLYAVVDKTKKKTNTHPDHIVDTDEKNGKGKEGLGPACEVVYAVVDKERSRSPDKCDNALKLGKKKRYQTRKGLWKKVSLKEDSSYSYNDWGEYQNIAQKLSGQEEEPDKLDVRSPSSFPRKVDGGRWVNSVGLLYVHPSFDVRNDVKYHPPPPHEATEYYTPCMITEKFPALVLDEESEQ